MGRQNKSEERIAVLTSNPREASRLSGILESADMLSIACADHGALIGHLAAGAAAALIAQEALSGAALADIAKWQETQPAWSDMPFVVLTAGRSRNPANFNTEKDLERLGNVTVLGRPIRRCTIRSTMRVALRARRRQYEVRGHRENLARAQRDIEQFAHSASHDLREPLRTVSLYSELLSSRYSAGLDEQGLLFLKYLKSAANRMEMLVADLLDFTQAAGIEEELPQAIAALEHLEAAIENLRESIAASGSVITHDPLPSVSMKPAHLQVLFQNLIANAVAYRREPPRIHIAAAAENGYHRFSVTDNGIGIEPQFQEQIFGIFKRLHADEDIPGTGIGLAICRRIVERYGGRIWVESELGKGSTFFFTIPAGDH